MVLLERPKETEKPPPKVDSREPSGDGRVQESVVGKNVSPITVEERERLAQFFILLDQMDRVHARMEQERRAG